MKRLLTTLVILSGLIGSGGAVWADAVSDFNKGVDAFDAGNFEEAVKWYRKSAEQGDALGQYALGWMYSNGKGVTQDYAEAVKWYRKSAEQGDASAQTSLGNRYRNGEGVTQDYAEAANWYRKAAEQGDASAQTSLGWMYEMGKGVTQDYAEALKWNRKAAQQGYARAQSNLGVMYRDGKGVTQDKITAHMWYNIAAANGNKRAVEGRDKVAKTLTVEQLVKANEQEERCIGNSNSTYFGKVIAYRDCDRKAKSWWKILYEIESGPDNNLLIIGLLIVFGLLPSIAILVVLIKKRDSLSWNTGSSWNFGSYKSTLSPKAFRSAHKWFFLVLFVLAVFILFLKATEEIP